MARKYAHLESYNDKIINTCNHATELYFRFLNYVHIWIKSRHNEVMILSYWTHEMLLLETDLQELEFAISSANPEWYVHGMQFFAYKHSGSFKFETTLTYIYVNHNIIHVLTI